MTLLDYSSRAIYSASVHNNWQRSAFRSYAFALSDNPVIRGMDGGETYDGYLYYTGDTDTVFFKKTGGAITITINSVGYSPSGDEGTFTVSGLTAGTVYAVSISGATTLVMLSFKHSVSSTSTPTFTASTVLTSAKLDDLHDALDESETAADILRVGFSFDRLSKTTATSGYEYTFWYGGLVYGGDTLGYTLEVGGNDGVDNTLTCYVNGTAVLTQTYPIAPDTNTCSGCEWGYEYSDTIDLSSLGLTAGNVYEVKWTEKQTTGGYTDITARMNKMVTYDTPTVLPDTEKSRGSSVDSASLTTMADTVDVAHPNYGAIPLSLHLPAMFSSNIGDESWTPTDYYYIRHSRSFLRYEPHGSGGDPEIIYSGGTISLETSEEEHTYDLYNISDMVMGEYYKVTNCKYAIEDVTDA